MVLVVGSDVIEIEKCRTIVFFLMCSKGRRFLNFEFVHPDSAREGITKTYLEKAIFIL